MRKIFGLSCLLFWVVAVRAQVLPAYPDSLFSTYYQQRVTHFRTLPKTSGDIIFLGNSLTDGAEWDELFDDPRIKNRGISGDITAGVINRIDEIAMCKPAKVFLLIGVNDLSHNTAPDSVFKNIMRIADYLHRETPLTQLYIQSILPVNNIYHKFLTHTNKAAQIDKVNALLQQSAAAHHYIYLNIHTAFCDADGKIRADLTNDGLHLKGEGYLLWKHLIYPYVFNLQAKPALLPMPGSLKWRDGYFPAYKCHTIIADKKLQKERGYLQDALTAGGIAITGNDTTNNKEYIQLHIAGVKIPQLADEGYHLQVTPNNIIITANTPHGIFNGIQTLKQLLRDNVIDACDITDYPAFAWRGLMVDVGRNFQSVALLEQQIDKMASYKLNVFHLHLTEDIAWRLYIKKYPQLTAPENMLRDKGMYYTPENIKELIDFCEARHIEFIPEIDMPGHSGAFKRAFKTDMQSDTGISILKNIIAEVCKTYKLNYLHIGGDEVKITNAGFLPAMCRYIERYKVKAISWSPGGSVPPSTIRQLWMKEGVIDANSKYIDSRHLYLNHMDPLESVVTIFNREIGDEKAGDQSMLGAEICIWNDRAVSKEEDVLLMNPVYPAMLTFAERSWCGGGQPEWTTITGSPGSDNVEKFAEFENRLLDNKKQYFKVLPFPYQKQSSLMWSFYGPYNNQGKLSMKFAPEDKDAITDSPAFKVVGGTVILRHWWYPLVKGVVNDPRENTTWYAQTKIWNDTDGYRDFWIGFNNFSRSYATDTPGPGLWSDWQSAVWINGALVPAPNWKHAGQHGNAETPLIDEGYEYRVPSKVYLKKGWNLVLIKLPVGVFKGRDWNNPVKWMFTFVPVN